MTKTLTRLPPRVAAVIDALNWRLALYDKLPWTGDRTVVIFGEAVVVRPRWYNRGGELLPARRALFQIDVFGPRNDIAEFAAMSKAI
jgi:hypothetical protein